MHSTSKNPLGNNAADHSHGGISEDSRALASRLSGHMGIKSALQISVKNQWHGVVAALMEIKQRNSRQG